jgi:serine/threonine-protein kinase
MNQTGLISILGFILAGCIYLMSTYDNGQAVGNTTNVSTYKNTTFGINLEYPSDWKKVEDDRGSWFRNTNESVNVRVESMAYQNRSLDQLALRQMNLTKQQFPGQVLAESNSTTIGHNYPAGKIVFTFPEEPADLNGTKYKEIQVWTINNSRAYIISYFTTMDEYDNYLPIAQKIIDSFRVISTSNK